MDDFTEIELAILAVGIELVRAHKLFEGETVAIDDLVGRIYKQLVP